MKKWLAACVAIFPTMVLATPTKTLPTVNELVYKLSSGYGMSDMEVSEDVEGLRNMASYLLNEQEKSFISCTITGMGEESFGGVLAATEMGILKLEYLSKEGKFVRKYIVLTDPCRIETK